MEGTAGLEFEVGGCRFFFANVVRFSSKIADSIGDSQGSEQVIANIRYWTGAPSQNMMCKRTLRGGLTFQLGEVSAFAQSFQVQTRHLEWPSIQSIYTYIYIYIHDIHLCFKYVSISINSCSIWLSHGVRLSGLKSKSSACETLPICVYVS